uniref:Uncharacterized protein n=1 Tax=Aegilops tauschii subsp. strangulata TaxID=200361 RepID=A0A453LM69_AEGTS
RSSSMLLFFLNPDSILTVLVFLSVLNRWSSASACCSPSWATSPASSTRSTCSL